MGAKTKPHPLKYVRAAAGAVVLLLFTALFIDISGLVPWKLHALAHLQLVPAILAEMVAVVVFLLILALILGRVYCSVLCPLGVLQDVIGRCKRIFVRKKSKHGKSAYHKPYNWLRYGFLAVAAIPPLAFASTFPLLLLDPYSNFGRIVTGLFKPVYTWGNNLIASIANAHGNFIFYAVPQYPSAWVSIFAAVVLLALVVLVVWRGRLWCNTVCPVGTLLGVVSRWSLVRIAIDPGRCNHCNRCVRACKAECIDQREWHVDMSRCVACYNCLGECNQGALKYKFASWGRRAVQAPAGSAKVTEVAKATGASTDEHTAQAVGSPKSERAAQQEATTASTGGRTIQAGVTTPIGAPAAHEAAAVPDLSRRNFLKSTAAALTIAPLAALAAKAAAATDAGGTDSLAAPGASGTAGAGNAPGAAAAGNAGLNGQADALLCHSPARYPRPPGAVADFRFRCTACQLCVSRCPMHVLRPAGLEHGITGIMQPRMYFETDVYCNYACTDCTHVCPTGALRPLTPAEKKTTQMGVVHFVRSECVVEVKHQDCGACAEHCPTGAVHMVPYDKDQSLTIPSTDRETCIGCGACESICPVRPRAIFVVASDPQGTALPPRDSVKGPTEVDGFGF